MAATGTPVVVLGGVETGLRPLAGTEQVLDRRWERRAPGGPVTVIGRPLPDEPADAERIMHPRVIADAVAAALRELGCRRSPSRPSPAAGASACG